MSAKDPNRRILIGLFVDDLIIAYHKDDEEEWLKLKQSLCKRYAMKDLGPAEWV